MATALQTDWSILDPDPQWIPIHQLLEVAARQIDIDGFTARELYNQLHSWSLFTGSGKDGLPQMDRKLFPDIYCQPSDYKLEPDQIRFDG